MKTSDLNVCIIFLIFWKALNSSIWFRNYNKLILSSYVTVDSLTKIEEEEIPAPLLTPGPGSVTPDQSLQQVEQVEDEIKADVEGELQAALFLTFNNWTKQSVTVITFYEGCSNMNASSFITFITDMLRPKIMPFWKELFVALKMAPNIK